jgi:MFS family permease
MEYFDFYAYGIAAAVAFPALFFGPLGPALGVAVSLASTLLIAVGRVIGGIIFGHLGDTRGRMSSLVLALAVMGVSTLAIGLLPTYAEIGVIAPVLLLTFRVIQGIGLGGEWGGAMTWTRETVGKSRWSGLLTGGIIQTSIGWGTILSSGVGTLIILITGQAFFAAPWGSWRYLFYIGVTLLAIAAAIRLYLVDSPLFLMLKSARRTVRSPVSVAFKRHWRMILMFSFMIGTTFFNIPVQTYSLAYFASKGFPLSTATLATSVAGIGSIIGALWSGILADFIGRKRAGIIATSSTLLLVYPYWYCVASLNPTLVILSTMIFFCSYTSISGGFANLFTESFPTEVRTTAAGFSNQLPQLWSFFLASGVWTPLVTMMGAPAAYPYILLSVSVWCIGSLTLWASPYVKETKGKELAETRPEAAND